MRVKTIFSLAVLFSVVGSVFAIRAFACGTPCERNACLVVSDDAAIREKAITALRQAGPEGLQALVDTFQDVIDQHALISQVNAIVLVPAATDIKALVEAKQAAELAATKWSRIQVALDAVGGQKDNHIAKLFWYTDLEQAKEAAKKSGKPILSLRLLGKLTDELSCANSRFFRTILYPHAEINKELQDNYILHWETFRNVPIVTIDFGDGRKMVRTLTGNSIHYILNAEGRPIEAIPGLYGPTAFLQQLQAAKTLHARLQTACRISPETQLQQYHAAQQQKVLENWVNDLHKINKSVAAGHDQTALAHVAAYTKYVSTKKPASDVTPDKTVLTAAELQAATTEDLWQQLAFIHAADAQLDAAGVAAVQAKNPPNAMAAGRLAISKSFVETPWMKMVRNLQNATALDTVKNEYTFHRQIHEWFANGQAPADLHQLNEKVYAQLFLMPSNDPWLGLSTPDQFSGITNGGLIENQSAVAKSK